MLTPFRKKIERHFRSLLTVLSTVIVSLDDRRFQRYRLVHRGWIWWIVPRLELESLSVVDLSQMLDRTVQQTEASLLSFAGSIQTEVRDGIKRSAASRAARDRTTFTQKVDELVRGSEALPSIVVKNGRASIQAVQRTLVESIGKIAKERFEASVKKTLAQILSYVRDEVGSNGSGKGVRQQAFPNGTKFFHTVKRTTIVVVEEVPRVRTVLWDNGQITLSFPYVVFVVYVKDGAFDIMQMFFRNAPLSSVNDELLTPLLPDIMPHRYEGELRGINYVCFPGPKVFQGSFADVTVSCQQMFWNSVFQSTHRQRHCDCEKVPNFTLEEWRRLSLSDPGFVLRTPWPKATVTIAKLFSEFKEEEKVISAREQLNNLERYVLEVSNRVATAIQEAVVEALAESEDMILARRTFDKQLQTALDELNLKDRLKQMIEEELTASCSEEKTKAILDAVSERVVSRFAELMRPIATDLSTKVTDALQGLSTRRPS